LDLLSGPAGVVRRLLPTAHASRESALPSDPSLGEPIVKRGPRSCPAFPRIVPSTARLLCVSAIPRGLRPLALLEQLVDPAIDVGVVEAERVESCARSLVAGGPVRELADRPHDLHRLKHLRG